MTKCDDNISFNFFNVYVKKDLIFCKYISFKSEKKFHNIENIILNNKLYFSNFENLNDPFDGRVFFQPLTTIEESELLVTHRWNMDYPGHLLPETVRKEIAQAFMKSNGNTVETIKKIIVEENRKFSICSFSIDFLNLSLWAYYADSYTGVCCLFDPQANKPKDKIFNFCFPVSYEDLYPKITILDGHVDRISTLKKMYFTKAKRWELEQEVRSFLETGPGLYDFSPNSLVGIIMGYDISSKNKNKLISWLKEREKKTNRKLALYQVKKKDEYEFKLIREEVFY